MNENNIYNSYIFSNGSPGTALVYLNYDFEQELIKKQDDIDIINYNLLEEELNKKHIAFFDFIKLKKLRILINNIYRNYSKNQISKSSEETYKHYNIFP